jgi:deoxyribonuclease V
VYRVVYSDGRVPKGSVELLSAEIKLDRKGNVHRVGESRRMEIERPPGPLQLLIGLQERMRPLLSRGPPGELKTIAGLDISSRNDIHASGMSIMDKEGKPLGELCRRGHPGLPYIPGLLFYREAPLLIPLVQDAIDMELIDGGTLLVLDGNGTLHPRRMGIACQLGIAADMMTCGAAKRLHVGKVSEASKKINKVEFTDILLDGDIIGAAMSGPGARKPVYVSPGNGIDLTTVMNVLSGLRRTRIPEPTRRAHELSNRCRSETVP